MIEFTTQRAYKEIEKASEEVTKLNDAQIRAIVLGTLGDITKNWGHVYGSNELVSKKKYVLDPDDPISPKINKGRNTLSEFTYFILILVQTHGFPNQPKKPIEDMLSSILMDNDHVIHPFKEKLNAAIINGEPDPTIYHKIMVDWLKAKDTQYSEDWLHSLVYNIIYQQLQPEDDNYNRAPYRYYLMGSQGIGKSRLFDMVSMGMTFNYSRDTKEADLKSNLATNAIMNMDDFGSGTKRETDLIKSLVTTNSDSVRFAYGRDNQRIYFKAMIVGSTNRQYVYKDTTGNRRELPLSIGRGLTREEAEVYGYKVFDLISQQVINDLYATVWKEANGKFDRPFTFPDKQTNKAEIQKEIQEHSEESPLVFVIDTLLNTRVPKNYGELTLEQQKTELTNEVTKNNVDPFAEDNTMKLKDMDRIPVKALNQVIATEAKENGVTNHRYSMTYDVMADKHNLIKKRYSTAEYYVKKEG